MVHERANTAIAIIVSTIVQGLHDVLLVEEDAFAKAIFDAVLGGIPIPFACVGALHDQLNILGCVLLAMVVVIMVDVVFGLEGGAARAIKNDLEICLSVLHIHFLLLLKASLFVH
ncbi:hypothetical protein ACGYK6_16610 [Sulfitobacter sp. 1A15333]|uniref:hypothetical protein n=1 Tax=Sulfitobacter sp. 1A15333 TaxID=3368570 RepID=UPI003744C36A